MRSLLIASSFIFQSIYASNALAAPCEDNFTSTGNMIVGSTYKTFAELPNVSPDSAYQGAYSDIAKEPSWKILSGDKVNGLIQVAQATAYSKGKTIPLNIIVEPINGGSKISIGYVTPPGTLSPESAIKAQFCQTIAAAANGLGSAKSPTVNINNQVNTPPNSNQNVRTQFGVATITPQQQNKIASELAKKMTQKTLQNKISEASPTIQAFLEKRSCLNDFEARSSENIFTVPGRSLAGFAPMITGMKYHDKQQCVTVARVSGWTSPALNALQFDVMYLAEDSGETATQHHEIVKQPDGVWLFTF